MLTCLEHTEGYERLLVDYDELLKEPTCQIQRIARMFQLKIDEPSLRLYGDDFIDRSLRHFHKKEHETFENDFCRSFSIEIYKTLLRVAKDEIGFHELKNSLEKWKHYFFEVSSLLVLAEKKEYEVEQLRETIYEREQTILKLSQSANKQVNDMMNFYNAVHQQNLRMVSLIAKDERAGI